MVLALQRGPLSFAGLSYGNFGAEEATCRHPLSTEGRWAGLEGALASFTNLGTAELPLY